MDTPALSDLLKLSPAERIQLAQDLWDSIPEDADLLPLTEERLREVERRLAAHDEDPSTAFPQDEVRARLRGRFGA